MQYEPKANTLNIIHVLPRIDLVIFNASKSKVQTKFIRKYMNIVYWNFVLKL